MLLSVAPFMCVNICSVYSDASILGTYIFAIVTYLLRLLWALYVMSYLFSSYSFCLKSILSDAGNAIPAFRQNRLLRQNCNWKVGRYIITQVNLEILYNNCKYICTK